MRATFSTDLHTGRSPWMHPRLPAVPHQPLTRDISTDVAIIGCGISGAMCAEELTAAGFRVAIFDKRGAFKGSTAASTSLLLYEIDTPLTVLSKRIGVNRAMRVWQRSRLALASLEDRIDALALDAGVERRPSLYLAGSLLDAAALKEEATLRRRAGFACDYLSRPALRERFQLGRQAALLTQGNLEANPVALAAGFLKAALARGACLYTPVAIVDVMPKPGHVELLTDEGMRITAQHAIYATGYEVPKAMEGKRHAIHSTWAIATKPQPAALWPERAFIWEASDPYLYLRTTAEGRVICGGEDEDFTDEDARDALLPAKTARLQQKLARLFPHLDTGVDYAWTGSFGSSTNGLPVIGPIPRMAHCYAVMAYGGNGITFSRLAAEIARGYLTGEKDADAALFAPKR